MQLKNNLKNMRLSIGISQVQLSYLSKVPNSHISQIEQEKMYCHPAWRERLAAALGVPVERVFPEGYGKQE